MEDMLHDARTRLTKVVVIGPGRAGLFYGRCSMGEGLRVDEARDAASLLTGAGTWVEKSAYLTADPMTIQEGRWAIAQAITDCQVKARGQNIPVLISLPNNPSGLTPQEDPLRRTPLGTVVLIINLHLTSPQGAENVIDVRETKGLHHLHSPHLSQIVDLRVTGIHYPWLPWCHLGLTGEMDLTPQMRETALRGWSLHEDKPPCLQGQGCQRCCYLPELEVGLMVYQHAEFRDHTLLPHAIRSLQGYPGELIQSSGMDIILDNVLMILNEHYNNVKVLDALNQELFQLQMADKEPYQTGASAFWGISRFWQLPSLIVFPLIVWQSWRETASMADFPSDWKWLWPTWRWVHR